MEPKRMKVKVCLVGEAAVGKTSLIRRFVLENFDDKYIQTLGTKVSKKELSAPNVDPSGDMKIDMTIWDIMGQKGFRELLREAYFFGAHGAIAVCDMTNRETLDELRYWIKALTDVAGEVPIVFVGNKADLESGAVIREDDVKALAAKYNAPEFMASAKTGENVETIFKALAEMIVAKMH